MVDGTEQKKRRMSVRSGAVNDADGDRCGETGAEREPDPTDLAIGRGRRWSWAFMDHNHFGPED